MVLVIALTVASIALSPVTRGEWQQLQQVPKLDRKAAVEGPSSTDAAPPSDRPESP